MSSQAARSTSFNPGSILYFGIAVLSLTTALTSPGFAGPVGRAVGTVTGTVGGITTGGVTTGGVIGGTVGAVSPTVGGLTGGTIRVSSVGVVTISPGACAGSGS